MSIHRAFAAGMRAESAAQYFFDAFARPATAFSLRDLIGTDPTVINVRRSSDDATSTFKTSEITDGTLVSWVGAGNDGEVLDWYNQGTGSIRYTVESWAYGPLIVDNGSLVTRNSNPSLYFDGTTDHYLVASDGMNAMSRPYGAFFVVALSAPDSNYHFFDQDTERFLVSNSIDYLYCNTGSGSGLNADPFNPSFGTLYSLAVIIESTSGQLWVDGVDNTNSGIVGSNDLGASGSISSLGAGRWGAKATECWYSELIVVPAADYANLLTDIDAIQNDQKTAWGTG